MAQILPTGTPAPEFTLRVTPDQRVSLSDPQGKPVILAFYPADWSPVCGDQVALYNEILPEFRRTTRSCSASRSTASWCHRRTPSTAGCTSRCSPISSPRARWRGATAPTAKAKAWRNARCSSSIAKA